MSSALFEYETGQTEAFYESVVTAARGGQRHRQLGILAMRAARAALVEGNQDAGDPEWEAEWEAAPAYFHQSFSLQEALPAALMMEHLAHGAAEAESDGEAFAFLAPLLPMALKALPMVAKFGAKMLPKIASTVMKAAPKVIKGVQGVARTLRNDPVSRPLIQALPNVVRQTTADIARQVAQGKPVTAQTAVRALARNTAKVLSDPRKVVQAVSAAKKADQRVHRSLASPAAAAMIPVKKPCKCQ
ncbi:MAG TPA: hypothetical protein VGF69_22150 [Thermoanaerobaculia bacterium]|jgi:hypothetical protein